MNYIKQLTAAIDRFSEDIELNPSHVSLYLALFYQWNLNRFNNPMSISRSDVMKVSKIGSKSTYHKCLNDLHAKGFLIYHPSHNPLRGSLIDMTIFETSTGTTTRTSTEQVVGQALVPSINSINNTNSLNNKKNTSFYKPTMDEVKDFFQNDIEAEKYFNYYSSKGWIVGNKSTMKDWKAGARNWKLNANKFQAANNTQKSSNHLHVEQNKDYNIPL